MEIWRPIKERPDSATHFFDNELDKVKIKCISRVWTPHTPNEICK